jgi:hypothetical protein
VTVVRHASSVAPAHVFSEAPLQGVGDEAVDEGSRNLRSYEAAEAAG